MASFVPRVFLVGAGPGDPSHLTLRGLEVLQKADFVLYDYLLSPRILDYAPVDAEKVCVTELPGEHPRRWPHIHARLIEEAKKGKCVVRLKGGDPSIFGRVGEEAQALREANIPYEIVPGVTAALAAGAWGEIPLTHRSYASALAIVTGHEYPEKGQPQIDWRRIAQFPGTLAVYMAVARLGRIAKELIAQGKSPDTPAAVIHRAGSGYQRTVTGTLHTIDEEIRAAGLTTPSLLLVGDVIPLRPAQTWLENRPLLGQRILITRPRSQSLELLRQLELLGAIPEHCPTLEPVAPADWTLTDQTLQRLKNSEFGWLVFTSSNGVDFFFQRLNHLNWDARSLSSCLIAVIGKSTAKRLNDYALRADLVCDGEMNSERLAEQLSQHPHLGNVLLIQAAEARETLRERLGQTRTVHSLSIYRQQKVIQPESELFDRLRRGEMDIITFTSPNIATTFLEACDEMVRQRLRSQGIRVVVNSSRLSKMLAERYQILSVCTIDPTQEGLINTLLELKA
ncbi:MAG: uroporphyrinogen-III C-methyltransferase [Gemmataceae bacterium]|jgi:uroporphyrinogen III methyltransferase/synthase|nr:uroporphyrinogen-III C-methyltransferase [Gemmataceae bacterium]